MGIKHTNKKLVKLAYCFYSDPHLGSLQTWPGCHHFRRVKRHLDVSLEWRARDVHLLKQNVNQVVAGLCRQVGDRAGPIAIVWTLDLGLSWPLHRQAQTSRASTLCIDGKLTRVAHQTSLETRTERLHLDRGYIRFNNKCNFYLLNIIGNFTKTHWLINAGFIFIFLVKTSWTNAQK